MPPAVRLRPEIVMEKLALRADGVPTRPGGDVGGGLGVAPARALPLDPIPPAGRAAGGSARHPPYAFVLSGRDWMVLAEDQAAGQVKLFYLARIEGAQPTKERYTIPRDFDAEKFFRNTFGLFVGDAKPFRMRVRFSPEVSDEVRELQFHPEQKIETTSAGEAILEMPAQSIKEARRFVLAWGKDAVVLEPPELIADLRAEAAGAALARIEEMPAGRRAGKRRGRTEKDVKRARRFAFRRAPHVLRVGLPPARDVASRWRPSWLPILRWPAPAA